MMPIAETLARAAVSGSCASVASAVALVAGGQRDCASCLAPINAVSHWVWRERALYQQDGSLRYTVPGYLIHHSMSVFWAVTYEALPRPPERPRPALWEIAAGLGVAALACLVDLRLTPQRLTPGFERRLGAGSLLAVYALFGLGLALPRLLGRRRAGGTPIAARPAESAQPTGEDAWTRWTNSPTS